MIASLLHLLPASPRARRLFAAGVLCAGLLHGAASFTRSFWEPDEAISYLTACAQLAAYEEHASRLEGRWVPASEWQQFLHVNTTVSFGQLRADLASDSIHPPLFFWLLHLMVVAFGVGVWQGPILNGALVMVTALPHYRLGLRLLGHETAAAFATCLWLCSPILIALSIARQYALLGLACTVLYLVTFRLAARPRDASTRAIRADLTALAAVTAAGLLTHYHFALALAACVLLVAWTWRQAWRRVAALAAACAAGALAAAVLHPAFLLSLGRHQAALSRPATYSLAARLERVAHAWIEFFVGAETVQFLRPRILVLSLVVLVLAISGVVGWRVGSRALAASTAGPVRIDPRALLLLFSVGGIVCGLYLLQQSLPHAMGRRYLTMAFPLFAPVVAWVLFRLEARPRMALAVPLAAGLVLATSLEVGLRSRPSLPPGVREAPAVISATIYRGDWPRLLRLLPPGTQVFATRSSPALERARCDRPSAPVFLRSGDEQAGMPVEHVRHIGSFDMSARGAASCASR
jgi:4-amino-4-deoxy-L-arabinose transferase-like glycosyltransferase